MKTLDLIRYITQHPEYKKIIFNDSDSELFPMEAINYLASIDPSHYDDFLWRLNGSLEKDILNIYR
jgi:hypothetical protein